MFCEGNQMTSQAINCTTEQSENKLTVAKLLVLGHRQVGKSAAIVRYTTGRFIQQYNGATQDWLYRHQPQAAASSVGLVELIEQKDIGPFKPRDLFASSVEPDKVLEARQTLASRAALDQRLAREQRDKQDLVQRLHWADAYVVLYALNDLASYNKAADYLELIESHQQTAADGSALDQLAASYRCNSLNNDTSSQTTTSSSCSASSSTSSSRYQPKNLSFDSIHESHQHDLMKPTLLLANKQDLGSADRQVSSTDGRQLAMRHRSMFAELSVAESQRLLDGCLATLLDQIEPSSLALETRQLDELSRRPLVQLNPNRRHNGNFVGRTQSSGPLQANLVRSSAVGLPLLAEEQFTGRLHGVRSQAAEVQVMRPPMVAVASSVEVKGPNFGGAITSGAHSLKRQIATSCKLLRKNQQAADERSLQGDLAANAHANTYQDRYRSLKSSFKKASLAIVSGRSLTSGRNSNSNGTNHKSSSSNGQRMQNSKRNSTSSDQGTSRGGSISELDSIVEPKRPLDDSSIPGSQHVSRSLSNASNSSDRTSRHQTLNRFNRSLFKYKSRRKTVAFEQVAAVYEHPDPKLLVNSTKMNDVNRQQEAAPSDAADSSPADLGFSSPGSQLSQNIDERSPDGSMTNGGCINTSQGHPMGCPAQRDSSLTSSNLTSNATWSRASTSAGSYEESSDELAASQSINSTLASLADPIDYCSQQETASHQHQMMTDSSKRHYLVKCMQSTLSNLTRASTTSSQPAKRSFCSSIFRGNSTAINGGMVKKVVATSPIVGLPKTENARAASVMVGFCK